jgi:hypothetical protein
MSHVSIKLSILLYTMLGFRPVMQIQAVQDHLNFDRVNDTMYNIMLFCVFIYWLAKVGFPVFKKWYDLFHNDDN